MTERVKFPAPPKILTKQVPEVERFFKDLDVKINDELDKRTPDRNAMPYLRLLSPDGSVWEVKVDNTGTISTTKIFG